MIVCDCCGSALPPGTEPNKVPREIAINPYDNGEDWCDGCYRQYRDIHDEVWTKMKAQGKEEIKRRINAFLSQQEEERRAQRKISDS